MCASHGMHVEVREQLSGIGSLFPSCGVRDLVQIVRLGCNCFYPLNHLVGPNFQNTLFNAIIQNG